MRTSGPVSFLSRASHLQEVNGRYLVLGLLADDAGDHVDHEPHLIPLQVDAADVENRQHRPSLQVRDGGISAEFCAGPPC